MKKVILFSLCACFLLCGCKEQPDSLITEWNQEREGKSPEITNISVEDNALHIVWKPMDTDNYTIDFGRASYSTTETFADISLNNSDWPNDMVGTDPMELHISNEESTDITVVTVTLKQASLHFAFYDGNHKEQLIEEYKSDVTLPACTQTFTVTDGIISIGPLMAATVPDGWHTDGDYSFQKELEEGENTISIFVY